MLLQCLKMEFSVLYQFSAVMGVDVSEEDGIPMLASTPYRALKGEQPKALWKEELYHNSAKDSHDFQLFGES